MDKNKFDEETEVKIEVTEDVLKELNTNIKKIADSLEAIYKLMDKSGL